MPSSCSSYIEFLHILTLVSLCPTLRYLSEFNYQNSKILVLLERFEEVEQFCKFKSERRRFKNEKEKDEKIQLLFEKLKFSILLEQKPEFFAMSIIKNFLKNLFLDLKF